MNDIPTDAIPAGQLLRLHLLRLATDTSPRLSHGVKPEDVLERARAFELYVSGPPPGSAQASGSVGPGTDTPGTVSDAGPADLRRGEGPKSAGSAQASV
jgi:hypothetical protein